MTATMTASSVERMTAPAPAPARPAEPGAATGALPAGETRLLALAAALDRDDRVLVEMVFGHGMKLKRVAQVLGQDRRAVTRRLRRLLRHLHSPLVRFLQRSSDLLPPATRRVTDLVVLRRLGLRRTAARTGLTLHQVRQHMRIAQALARL